MENRALGKGLSALIPDRIHEGKTDKISYLKIQEIQNNTLQPRSDFKKADLDDLKASIKEKGVLQPILVRQREQGYEVVAGERRLRAARELNMEEVPAVIRDISDNEALVLALVENIQREELNPIEEAQAFSRLINEFNYTQDTIAKSVGKDRSTISNILRLLKLPIEIQKSVVEGLLTFGHARALLAVNNESEQMHLYLDILKRNLSVRELENIIKGDFAKGAHKKKSVSKKQKDSYIIAAEEDMQRMLGTKVRIKAKKKRGTIEIDYYSHDDFNRIFEIVKNNTR